MRSRILTLFIIALASFSLSAQVRISDQDLVAGQTYNWDSGTEYLLDGLVFLEAGATLNIPAGTVIRGKNSPTTGDNTSALIVARGATINALGTADAPIIFTAEEDLLDDPGDFTPQDRGEWGGIIILGAAPIARPSGEDGVEGIDADEDRAKYGGDNVDDNSGIITYVSIRHGGASLSPNNEINGLTLGGVGAGTTIDYIEVIANFDDGIEFFGGTVGVKHAVVSFCGDDAFDYDYGYRGKGQFWYSYQSADYGGTGRAGEHDGASPDNQAPFSKPTIYNATYIGVGQNAFALGGDAADDNAFAVVLRDNTGGSYNNSIFTEFNGSAIGIEDRADSQDGDSYARLQAGDLEFKNNLFFAFGDGNNPTDLFQAIDTDEADVAASSAVVVDNFTAANNQITDPGLQEVTDRTMLDPRPSFDGAAASGAPVATDDFFDAVTYYGAFAPGNGDNNPYWLSGWTAIDEYGFVALTVGVNTVEQSGFTLDAPVPNPANDQAYVTFELPVTATVTITVVDMLGRPVQHIMTQATYSSGEQRADLDVSRLAAGPYLVLLEAENARLIQKLIVNH